MAISLIALIVVLGVFLLIDQKDEIAVWWRQHHPAQTVQAAPAKPEPQRTTIKGFYIGMPESELVEKINQIPGLDYKAEKRSEFEYEAGFRYNLDAQKSMMIFRLDRETRKLASFSFLPDAANIVFNSFNLNDKEFVAEFAKAYKLPEFNFRVAPNRRVQWVCKTADNVLVTIWQEKGVVIERFEGDATTFD